MATARTVNHTQPRCLPGPTATLVTTKIFYCPYLARGHCYKSAIKCAFSHDPKSIKVDIKEYCPFFLENRCQLGHRCRRKHTEPCRYPQLFIIPPTAFRERMEHFRGNSSDLPLAERLYDQTKNLKCGICLDIVVNKRPFASSLFGMLENCDHVFCLDCIMRWRQEVKTCPECRVSSNIVIPNHFWFDGQREKSALVNNYKRMFSPNPQSQVAYLPLPLPLRSTRPRTPTRPLRPQPPPSLRPAAPSRPPPPPAVPRSSPREPSISFPFNRHYLRDNYEYGPSPSYPNSRGSSTPNQSVGFILARKLVSVGVFIWTGYKYFSTPQ